MLRMENLCAGYDGGNCLHGVTARLQAGRLTAVIGPNGCGKSTMIKCMAGLLRPRSGSVRIQERMLSDIPEKERARMISYMPQSRVVPDISVRQLVNHGRYPHLKWGQAMGNADRQIVQNAIERAGMLPYAHRSVSQLSGGERQRAYLAMMLAQQTPVMLLDEPTAYLDLAAQFSLMDLLGGLCWEGRCVVTVLHDLALALEYADEILLMQTGRLVQIGTPEAVYASGQIQAVFGIDIQRTAEGNYLFSQRRQEVIV